MVKDHSDTMSKFPAAISLATLSDNIYAPSHREDTAYYSLCYTSYGELAGKRVQKRPSGKIDQTLRFWWDGEKEMFYLMIYSIHFIYGYMA